MEPGAGGLGNESAMDVEGLAEEAGAAMVDDEQQQQSPPPPPPQQQQQQQQQAQVEGEGKGGDIKQAIERQVIKVKRKLRPSLKYFPKLDILIIRRGAWEATWC